MILIGQGVGWGWARTFRAAAGSEPGKARQGKAARRQKLKPGTGHAEASQARIPSSPPSYPFAGNKRPSGPEEVNCGSGSLQIIWPTVETGAHTQGVREI